MSNAKRERQRARKALRDARPAVHVEIAHLSNDLRAAARLAKPAILYADKVTIYSPAASLLRSAEAMANITDTVERAQFMIQMMEEVPELAPDVELDPQFVELVRGFTGLPRPVIRRTLVSQGATLKQLDGIFGSLDGLNELWDEKMPEAAAAARTNAGAEELWDAIECGAVEVADVSAGQEQRAVVESVRAAAETPGHFAAGDPIAEMIEALVSRIIEIVTEPTSFPLFDPQAAGLFRSLERDARVVPSDAAMRQGAEVDAATRFMGYLPYFPDLPMAEILDLRGELHDPLVRFRSAMRAVSDGLQSRAVDPDFPADVESAWRETVEPALLEIEERLREHGVLREARSVVLGSPYRVLADAVGGAFVASHQNLVSLSGLLAAAAAAAPAVLDVAGQTAKAVMEERSETRRNSFYFLHRLNEESASRSPA